MALPEHKAERHGNESFGEWTELGTGGFGKVYKARHNRLGLDVSIKILHKDVCAGSAMCEANNMEIASCPFVLMLYGIYEGCPPLERGTSETRKGIVMELMPRGSLESLQRALSGPPPWPLACRLAYEVALGMNFLHRKKLVHGDLKPSNVLLTDDLHAKIADFGLSRVSHSALNRSAQPTGEEGGSYKYMPPEAFQLSYKPVRAFDIYSYGILLWSIFTGQEPYPSAAYARVELRIPKGDRPDLGEIDQTKAEMRELVKLMGKYWHGDPLERPESIECTTDIDKLYSKRKKEIDDVVYEVKRRLVRLDSPDTDPRQNTSHRFMTPEQPEPNDSVDFGRETEPKSALLPQDTVDIPTKTMSMKEKETFVNEKRATIIQEACEVMAIVEAMGNMVHKETYSKIEAERTDQGKMRQLYSTTLRSGGAKVKAAFFDVLKEQQPDLVERLGG